uniref:Uncharacterized protein n=1 Tax=Amphora coffeiformis TaxID=265554 RepID=A0A7S3P7D6_9STRA
MFSRNDRNPRAERNPRRFVRGRNAPRTSATPTLDDSKPASAPTDDPPSLKDEVVGEFPQKSQHPYTSISLSPSKKRAVAATNDTLQLFEISPSGLVLLKSFSCAPLFVQTPSPAAARSTGRAHNPISGWRGAAPNYNSFSMATGTGPSLTNVIINDVAWSRAPAGRPADESDDFAPTTWIAAGGSNGVIILWSAQTLRNHVAAGATLPASATAPAPPVPPDAVLRQHMRAVNRIDWHPWDPAVFLSASQDGTVRMWERTRKPRDGKGNNNNTPSSSNAHGADSTETGGPHRLFQLSLFGGSGNAASANQGSFVWQCTTVFEPKSEAVRDVAWNPFEPDVFALVTAGGTLVCYHRRVKIRSLVKLTAHGREASCLDWHPRLPNIVATGGANDGSVKVWDLSKQLDPEQWSSKPGHNTLTATTSAQLSNNMTANYASVNSRTDSIHTETSENTDRSSPSFLQNRNLGTVLSAGVGPSLGSRAVHVLSVAASVTRVKWRPSAGESFVPAAGSAVERKYFDDDWSDDFTEHPLQSDRHDALLAVSTAPVGWVSAGGAGSVALWSCHRPFMALSVVEGHNDGAVVDFVWLETPVNKRSGMPQGTTGRLVTNTPPTANVFVRRPHNKAEDNASFRSLTSHRNEDGGDNSEHSGTNWLETPTANTVVGIWQHVLSVGKDGRVLVQSMMRGDRPLSRVPPSCFAMANLSPFQRGYGSLQLFTVCQPVPSGPRHDYLLTGLRRDTVTAEAPGMFRETPTEEELAAAKEQATITSSSQWSAARRLPPRDPVVVFNVLDQGDLDDDNLPQTDEPEAIVVAPEVVHMSRFAGSYILRPTEEFPTRYSICVHNSSVADELNCPEVSHLWSTLGSMLEGSGMNGLAENTAEGDRNLMQFLILPTVKTMIEELAEEGDVQTCVAICEVLVRPFIW